MTPLVAARLASAVVGARGGTILWHRSDDETGSAQLGVVFGEEQHAEPLTLLRMVGEEFSDQIESPQRGPESVWWIELGPFQAGRANDRWPADTPDGLAEAVGALIDQLVGRS